MRKTYITLLAVGLFFMLVLSACSNAAGAETKAQKPDAAPAQATTMTDEAIHEEGDEHAADEHGAEVAHQEGDDHAADEHETDARHEEGDEHAAEEHKEGHGHDEEREGDHDSGAHGAPEDAAAVPNPIEAGDESIAIGRELYSVNCVACHGESGEGDGPAAVGFDPPPANLHEDHVQVLSDGALFYIIQNGVEGTGMPAWGETLDEEQIWHVVNFIRTYGE